LIRKFLSLVGSTPTRLRRSRPAFRQGLEFLRIGSGFRQPISQNISYSIGHFYKQITRKMHLWLDIKLLPKISPSQLKDIPNPGNAKNEPASPSRLPMKIW
jgi:hypothetical protein